MLEKRRRVKTEKILAGSEDVDGRIGEKLEEVLEMIQDDGSDDFEAQKLIVNEELDKRESDQRDDGAFS